VSTVQLKRQQAGADRSEFDFVARRVLFSWITWGIVVVSAVTAIYFEFGFNWFLFTAWLVGLLFGGLAFWNKKFFWPGSLQKSEILIGLALLAVALPTYLWSIYDLPFQVCEDERCAVEVAQKWPNEGKNDMFGLSPYFGFPFFPYLLLGWIGRALGGVDLFHQRLIQGVEGVIIAVLSFFFLRMLGLRKSLALFGAIFICFNHSLVAMSRIAFKDNVALLVELLALLLLYRGLIRNCALSTYAGGLLTGIGYYVYYPARIVLPIWLIFLALVGTFHRRVATRSELLSSLLVFSLGVGLTVMPLLAGYLRDPRTAYEAMKYQRGTCLLYSEGQQFAMFDENVSSPLQAIMLNAINGLTVFNNNIGDHGLKYLNWNHGFVDPVSGILVWIGFIWVLIFYRGELALALVLPAFLLQMFLFSFVICTAPNYTRLLIILPFAAYLIAHGADAVASFWAARFKSENRAGAINAIVLATLMITIVSWNAYIFADYALQGIRNGNDIGGTARYLESRKGQPNHLYFVAASPEYPYFLWDIPGGWNGRMSTFISPLQSVNTLAPEDVDTVKLVPPFTMFMGGKLWNLKQANLIKAYPHLIVHKIEESTGCVALEEPTNTANSRDGYRSWNGFVEKMDDELSFHHYRFVKEQCLQALASSDAMCRGSLFKSKVLLDLGLAYNSMGEYEKAKLALMDALSLREMLTGPIDLETVKYVTAIADNWADQKQWQLAEQWYRKALKIAQDSHQSDPSYFMPPVEIGNEYEKIALVLWQQGRIKDADQTLSLIPDYHDGTNPLDRKARFFIDMGMLEKGRARYANAAALLERAVQLSPKSNPDNNLAQLYAELGYIYLMLERFSDAEKAYDNACQISTLDCPAKSGYERDRQFSQFKLEEARKMRKK